MHRSFVARREQSGRFDDDLHAEPAPRQLGRVAFCQHLHRLAIDEDGAVLDFDLVAELAVDGIVFEELGEGGRVGDVVDGDDLEVLLGQGRAQEHPAYPAESVNPDFYRHRSNPPHEIAAFRTLDKSAPYVQILRRAASRMQWAWGKGNHFIEMRNPPWVPAGVTPAPSDLAYGRLKMRVAFLITWAPRTAGSTRRRFA